MEYFIGIIFTLILFILYFVSFAGYGESELLVKPILLYSYPLINTSTWHSHSP